MLWLQILGLVAALAVGLWVGRPRSFKQSSLEIDELLEKRGEHRKAKRHITFINLLQRKVERGSHRRQKPSGRRPFQL